MAHISCHSSDIVPNRFPPPRPSVKDHGMISAYEKDLVMHHTFPHSRQGFISGDEFPVLNFKPKPVQTERATVEALLDPALCVTPEKPGKPKRNSFNPSKYVADADVTDEEDEAPRTSSKTTHKVRFDQNVDVRHLSPEGPGGCDIIEIDRRGDPCLELSLLDHPPPMPTEDISGTSGSISTELIHDPSAGHTFSVCSNTNSQCHGKANKEMGEQTKIDKKKTQFHSSCKSSSAVSDRGTGPKAVKLKSLETRLKCGAHGDMNECRDGEAILAKPQLYSTIQVSREIQQLHQQDLDLAATVEQKLKVSSTAGNKITEKACSKVNQAGQQFPSLVSLEVHEEELLQAAAPMKVKSGAKSKLQRPEDSLSHEPDILEFFTPNLQKESASFKLHGLPDSAVGFQSSDLSHAFDVYRHIRAWEGWS